MRNASVGVLPPARTTARAAEVLVRNECSFKFGTDIRRVAELTGGWYERGGGGRFITVYPRDDEQFRMLADGVGLTEAQEDVLPAGVRP